MAAHLNKNIVENLIKVSNLLMLRTEIMFKQLFSCKLQLIAFTSYLKDKIKIIKEVKNIFFYFQFIMNLF